MQLYYIHILYSDIIYIYMKTHMGNLWEKYVKLNDTLFVCVCDKQNTIDGSLRKIRWVKHTRKEISTKRYETFLETTHENMGRFKRTSATHGKHNCVT